MDEQALHSMQQELRKLQKDHQQLLQQLQQGQTATLYIARQAWRAQEEERGRLARELHDGLGQNLTALKNALIAIHNVQRAETRKQSVEDAIALCAECIEDTRSMSRLLRPAVLDDLGLASALRQLCRNTGKQGLAVELVLRGDLQSISKELGTLVYRLVQEAINNALKHADAALMVIQVIIRPATLQLVMMDDGQGFDPDADEIQREGFGLNAMHERVALFGGSVDIESAPGEGAKIRVIIPRQIRGEST